MHHTPVKYGGGNKGPHNLRLLKKTTVLTLPPRRAKTRLSTGKAAASEEARRYAPHFVWQFAMAMDLGERKNPFRDSDIRRAGLYTLSL